MRQRRGREDKEIKVEMCLCTNSGVGQNSGKFIEMGRKEVILEQKKTRKDKGKWF